MNIRKKDFFKGKTRSFLMLVVVLILSDVAFCDVKHDKLMTQPSNNNAKLFRDAQNGDADAEWHLGKELQTKGKLKDAKIWLRRAALKGHKSATKLLAVVLYNEENFKEAKYWLTQMASKGDLRGQYGLGVLLFHKEGKIDEAMKWFEASASQGLLKSQFALGRVLYKEKGKLYEAKLWLKKAAIRGHVNAQLNLADLFEKEGNIDKAKYWYEKASDQGSNIARNNLGLLFLNEGNLDQAKIWYEKAARDGSKKSQVILAGIFQNQGKTKEAIEWFEKAAAQDHVIAKSRLGSLYHNLGQDAKAKYWWTQAANGGEVIAQYQLGLCYRADLSHSAKLKGNQYRRDAEELKRHAVKEVNRHKDEIAALVEDTKSKVDSSREDVRQINRKTNKIMQKHLAVNNRADTDIGERQIYIFVSSSMKKRNLIDLAHQARKQNAALIMRGFIDNSYLKTAMFFKTIIDKTGEGVVIDPGMFKAYQVEEVPTFVIARGNIYDKLRGNVTLKYAIAEIKAKGEVFRLKDGQ